MQKGKTKEKWKAQTFSLPNISTLNLTAMVSSRTFVFGVLFWLVGIRTLAEE